MVKEKWEDEFDKRTEWSNVEGINFSYDYELGIFRNPLEALKDFISKTIQQARQEERELIKEKIMKMEITTQEYKEKFNTTNQPIGEKIGYNQALEDILNIINKE